MVGWHHRLNGHGFGWTPGVGDGQGGLGSQRVRHDWRLHFHALEKEMETHSSVLAWRIPGTEEPGGLPSMGCTESDTSDVT